MDTAAWNGKQQGATGARLRPYALQVDGHSSPLGVDNPAPRFTWRLESAARGAAPAGARLWVATSAERLREGADVWDSGELEGEMLAADYAGPKLAGSRRYWWRVAVTDETGQTVISEVAFFDTGLFPGDWRSSWIWRSSDVSINDFAYLRKEIVLRGPVALAKLYVSAHNTAQIYVDGVRISGFGLPAPTAPAKRKYYLAYDATSLITHGTCCIAAIAHYLGGGGQNYVNGLPGFRLQLEVVYADGSAESFGTDTSWQALKEMPHRPGTPYQQKRRVSAIEQVDARKREPQWLLAGYDSAKCLPATEAAAEAQSWPMQWQRIAEGAVDESIVPTLLQRVEGEDGEGLRQVFDAGKIVSGWPRLALAGVSGATVRMRYSEDLDEMGFVKHNVCNERSDYYYDEYTMNGDGWQTWQPDLSFKAFRYVEISGYPQEIVPGTNVWIVSARTGLAVEGSFNCSEPLLNELYAVSMQTQKNNVLGQIVDCPHREQAQYLADSDLQAELLLYNFDARHALDKVVADFADGQLEDGTFPFVFPSNVNDPAFKLQIPEWDLHYTSLLRKLYDYYGDERALARYWEPASRMADYYLAVADNAVGLVPLDKGWHISDWPYPTVDHQGDYLTVQNVKLYESVRALADIASVLGREADHDKYARQAERLGASIVAGLYDRERKRYRDSSGSTAAHQGVTAIAALASLVPAEDVASVAAQLADEPWVCKTVLSLPLLRFLFEHGRPEAAYRLINRESYPGWGYMIKMGARTLWEGWDDIESHCHAWNGYPARLLQEYIVGIRRVAAGFAAVRIKPYWPADLSYAEATVPTVRGPVRSRWERLDGGNIIILTVSVPPTMAAELVVADPRGLAPARVSESGIDVWRDGRFCEGATGVNDGAIIAEGLRIGIAPGSYSFTLMFGEAG